MAIAHAQPNEVVDVRPYGGQLPQQATRSIFKSTQLEVLRLVLPQGKVIAEHKAPGEITVHCLEGRINFTAKGQTQELQAGHLLYLTAGEPHALESLEDASVLVTLALASRTQ